MSGYEGRVVIHRSPTPILDGFLKGMLIFPLLVAAMLAAVMLGAALSGPELRPSEVRYDGRTYHCIQQHAPTMGGVWCQEVDR